MAERSQQLIDLREIGPDDALTVARFIQSLPEGDRTFLKEDIDDDTVQRWCNDPRVKHWIAVGEDGAIQAMVSITPGALWSSHVGELRLVVGHDYRRMGLGRRLARYGLAQAVRLGLSKIVVEVVADKEQDIAMFTSIGFDAEALLRDQIRDRDGDLRDLVLLAHDVNPRSAAMDVLGLAHEVGMGGGQ
jgi:ribosomal protein S18 acetylase RimI-like enzyme